MHRMVLAVLLIILPSLGLAEIKDSPVSQIMAFDRQQFASIPKSQLRSMIEPQKTTSSKIYSQSFLDKQPAPHGGKQWKCLAEALYFEARGETIKGQFAVAEVILNRVKSTAYPDTICDVVNQGTGRKFACQFTYTCDGLAETIHEPDAYTQVGKVARILMDGAVSNLTNGATHYHTTAVRPSWARKFPKTAAIGSHLFYRRQTKVSSN